MKITTYITRKDIAKVSMFLWPRVRANWILLSAIFVLYLAVTLTTVESENLDATLVAIFVLVAATLAALFTAFGLMLCLAINLSMASQKTGLGEHQYEVMPDGLQETTSMNAEFSKWVSFDDLFKSRNYIILKKHWAALHIFPKRNFDSPQHFLDFFDALRHNVKK